MGTDAERAVLELLRGQRMLLFVGAGLSLELGYPLWNDYLAALEKELGAKAPSTENPLERAEWIKHSFEAAQRHDDYLAHIQQNVRTEVGIVLHPAPARACSTRVSWRDHDELRSVA